MIKTLLFVHILLFFSTVSCNIDQTFLHDLDTFIIKTYQGKNRRTILDRARLKLECEIAITQDIISKSGHFDKYSIRRIESEHAYKISNTTNIPFIGRSLLSPLIKRFTNKHKYLQLSNYLEFLRLYEKFLQEHIGYLQKRIAKIEQ